MVTTFGKPWLRHVNDGIVYASFNQVGTDTGRYSCSKPNLQNIPVRSDGRYRDAFIARPGYRLITADLSQIEYRLAGEFSGQQSIIDEYNTESPDFHQLTATSASNVLGRTVPRAVGKTMNFALIYQAGPKKLVEVLGCKLSDAKDLHRAFWSGYDRLQEFMIRKGYDAVVNGFSETRLGRRRYFRLPHNSPRWMVEQVKREGGNMPIQGSAADMLKLATLNMFPRLNYYGSRLIHQVHDEVVVEVPLDHVDDVQAVITDAMSVAGAQILEQVPVVTSIKTGDHWEK
jgi:DNA polymerase-1